MKNIMKVICVFLLSMMLLFASSGCGKYSGDSDNNKSNENTGGDTVDTTPPTLSRVTAPPGSYGTGGLITLTATFSEAVTVTQGATLTLDVGGAAVQASLSSTGSSSVTHTFTYTVDVSQDDANGIEVTGFTGTIQDGNSNDLSALSQNISLNTVLIDLTSPPTLIDVTAMDGTYQSGSTITLTAVFSEVVTVAQGATLTLDVGGAVVQAGLSSTGSSSATHTFTYTVGASHDDANGIEVTGFTGTIQDGDSNDLSSLSANIFLSAVLVDNLPNPQAVVSRVAGESGNVRRQEVVDVLITFNEDVQNFDMNDITVSAGVTKSHFVMSTARKYWVSVTPPSTGTEFSVSVADGVAQSSAGANNLGSQALTVSISGTCTSGGTGNTESDPIIICNYQGLKNIGNDLSKHYRLGVHINARASWFEGSANCSHYDGEQDPTDSNCAGWTPLGELTGSLDGANFEIRNLYINSQARDAGLFAEVDGYIKNLHLRRVRVHKREDSNTGGFVGALFGSSSAVSFTIEHCSVTGHITSSDNTALVGGLVGKLELRNLVNSWADVSVSGKYTVGGLVAKCTSGCSIVSSWSKGTVTQVGTRSLFSGGGLVGGLDLSAKIQNSYSHVNVVGVGRIGGLVGGIDSAEIYKNYSTGTVSSGQGHGFFGSIRYTPADGSFGLEHNFWDTTSSGRTEAIEDGDLPSNKDESSEPVVAPIGLTTSAIQVACTGTTGICALGSGFQFTAGQYPKVKKCTTCSGNLVFSSDLVGGQ